MSGELHGRDVTNDAFYEWLLSDHPDARAERDWRRAATYQAETDRAAAVRAWADKINAQPDAPQPLQDLAASPTRPRNAPKSATPNPTTPTSPGCAPSTKLTSRSPGRPAHGTTATPPT